MNDKKFLTVCKSGLILGIGRKTCIPLAALEQADFNMMFPKQAERREFVVSESKKE